MTVDYEITGTTLKSYIPIIYKNELHYHHRFTHKDFSCTPTKDGCCAVRKGLLRRD